MTLKRLLIKNPILSCEVLVLIEDQWTEETVRKVGKFLGEQESPSPATLEQELERLDHDVGRAYWSERFLGKFIIAVSRQNKRTVQEEMSTIVHEACHVVHRYCDQFNIEHTDELKANMVGNLCEEIFTKLYTSKRLKK